MNKDFHREDTIRELFVNAFALFIQRTRQRYGAWGRLASWLGMFWCVLRHGASPADYIYYDFDRKNDRERSSYFTMLRFERFLKRVNTGDKGLFMNKARFCRRFEPYLQRPWLEVDQAGQEEFEAFILREGSVICKPLAKSGGHGIFQYTYEPGDDLADVKRRLAGMLVERIIVQHPEMAAFNPNCVNALRLVTLIDKEGEPRLFTSFFRCGTTGAVVDNLCSGGFVAPIDLDSGVVRGPGRDLNGGVHLFHPLTGKTVPGFRIPHWEQAKALVLQAAREVPDIRWVGWDVAVTQDGVCIVEGNDRSECRSIQYCDGHGWRRQAWALV